MLLHLGSDVCVPEEDILVILNNDNLTSETERFLSALGETAGETCICPRERARSIIVTLGVRQQIYWSAISAGTLLRRAGRRAKHGLAAFTGEVE